MLRAYTMTKLLLIIALFPGVSLAQQAYCSGPLPLYNDNITDTTGWLITFTADRIDGGTYNLTSPIKLPSNITTGWLVGITPMTHGDIADPSQIIHHFWSKPPEWF